MQTSHHIGITLSAVFRHVGVLEESIQNDEPLVRAQRPLPSGTDRQFQRSQHTTASHRRRRSGRRDGQTARQGRREEQTDHRGRRTAWARQDVSLQ